MNKTLIGKILKNKWFIGGAVIIIIIIAYYSYSGYQKAKSSAPQYITSAVTKDTVVSSITGTGQVEASDQIDIKPQTDGQLVSVPVQLNQQVKKGQTLGIIDQQSAANSVAQAKANLEQAQANYNKLIAGATADSIQAQQISIKAAQQALDQANQNYQNTVTTQEQAVSKALSTFLNADLTAVPSNLLTTASVSVDGNYSGTDKGTYNISLYIAGDGLHYSASGLGTGSNVIKRGTDQPIGNGLYINFGITGTIDPSTSWAISIPNEASNSYLNNLNAYNTALQTQQQDLQNAQASIDSAQNNLDKANNSYQTTTEPPTQADVDSAKAQITSSQAQLDNAETAYQATILTAPFDGVVATLDLSVGDKITAGTTFATIITKQQVAKITLNEVDVAKVKVGQKATLSFDAIDGLTLTGAVDQVDTLGTVSQGVVSYGVQIGLDTQDDRIKPGMSVSASIIIGEDADVLTVPNSAVKSNSGGSYVQILDNSGKPQNVSVQTGLSNDTETEITSGLTEGQKIITQTITSKSASSGTTNSASSGLRIPGITTGGGGGGGTRTFTTGRGGG